MNRTSGVLFLAIGISLFMFTSGCDSIGQKSPSQVVIAAYMAANEGKYSETEKYLSSIVLKFFKIAPKAGVGGSIISLWDRATRYGTIRRIEILGEKVRGIRATVSFRIHFKDGKTNDEKLPLIKEDGQWKITTA
jgi:hypothetical protein